jgi:hypothetical protein
MSMISTKPHRVKPTRHTARPSAPFGAGIYPTRTRFEPSEDDRRWAAQTFGDDADWDVRLAGGDEPESDWDMLAGEAASLDAMCAMTPPPAGICKQCGEFSEALSWGMCRDCFDDAATDAGIACVNALYGLGYRVF